MSEPSNRTLSHLATQAVLVCLLLFAATPVTGQGDAVTPLPEELKKIADRVAENYDQERRMFIEGTVGMGGTDIEFAFAMDPAGAFFGNLEGIYLTVFNGNALWLYSPKANVYTSMPASEIPEPVVGLKDYLSAGLSYHARELRNPRRRYRLAGEETLSVAGQNKRLHHHQESCLDCLDRQNFLCLGQTTVHFRARVGRRVDDHHDNSIRRRREGYAVSVSDSTRCAGSIARGGVVVGVIAVAVTELQPDDPSRNRSI